MDEKKLFEVFREFPYKRRLRHPPMATQLVKPFRGLSPYGFFAPRSIGILVYMMEQVFGSLWIASGNHASNSIEIDASNGPTIGLSNPDG